MPSRRDIQRGAHARGAAKASPARAHESLRKAPVVRGTGRATGVSRPTLLGGGGRPTGGSHAADGGRPRHIAPRSRRRGGVRLVLLVALLVVGLGLMVYPMIASYMYEATSSRVVAEYDEATSSMSDGEIARQFQLAEDYNEELEQAHVTLTDPFDPSAIEEVSEPYSAIMNLAGDGVIGHVEIPKINVDLPIYHGTSSEVLEKGVGHMANSSLPTGKAGTHVVLTGHTGLSHSRMFTDLPELTEGDVFYLHVLGQTFAYKVVRTDIVEPHDSSLLETVEGKEYVTLLTCYPYGINSHRLLVRGERIPLDEAQQASQEQGTSSIWDAQYHRAILICVAAYVPLTVLVILVLRRRRRKGSYVERPRR